MKHVLTDYRRKELINILARHLDLLNGLQNMIPWAITHREHADAVQSIDEERVRTKAFIRRISA